MTKPTLPKLLAPAIAAVAAVAAAPAAALGSEGESSLAVSGSYAALADVADGFDLGVSFDRGIREQVFWHIAAGGELFAAEPGLTLYAGRLTLGVKVLWFDIVKWVPYTTVGVGASVRGGGDLDTEVDPRLELGLGLDRMASRSFSYGVEARFEIAAPRAAFDQPELFLVGLKVAWRWGFF